jgi:hypothetical protein
MDVGLWILDPSLLRRSKAGMLLTLATLGVQLGRSAADVVRS